MRLTSVALGAWLSATTVIATPADAWSVFTNTSNHWDAHTTIDLPNSPDFANATERWNPFSEPTYAIAISPATPQDAAKAISIARSINLPFLGTGGRHGTSLVLGTLKNGLAIDLSKLNSIKIDSAAGTLTAGGGVRFGDIYDDVYNAGFELPVGSCACPGLIGATIGGGVGRWQGVHGLIIDTLVSAEVITAEGKLVTANATSNPDLFWAIRGAGANFGLLTSATYQLQPQINKAQMMTADFVFPASQNASYFDIVQSLQTSMPAELATITIIEYNSTVNEAQILANWVYLGPEEEGRKYIAPLLKLEAISTDISEVAYNKIVDVAIKGLGRSICTPGTLLSGYGVNYRNLSSATFQTVFKKLDDFYVKYPDGRSSGVEMEIFSPAAVEKISETATAYPWRDSRGYALISGGWNSSATHTAAEALAQGIRADYVASSGYGGLAVYPSYNHGDEQPSQLFGVNLPRLTQLKKKWDPDNVFRFFHPVPLTS